MEKMIPQSIIILLVSAILTVSSCTTIPEDRKLWVTGCETLDIAPESMSESIDIGTNIEVETKAFVYRITVTGYEENKSVIGIEEFDGREVRIPFDSIIKIGTGTCVFHSETNSSATEFFGEFFRFGIVYWLVIIYLHFRF